MLVIRLHICVMNVQLQQKLIMNLLLLIIIFNIATLCYTIELSNDDEHPLTCSETMQLHIHMAMGYKLHVTVTKLNTEPDAMDFLLIKPGENLEDGEGSGFVFTYGLDEPRSFIVFSNDVVINFEVNGRPSYKPYEFSLIYKRVGEEILTTTENPISTSTWPQPHPKDSIYLSVYVDGLPMNDYTNLTILEDFKTAVGHMATEYVLFNNETIPVASNISGANVLINNLKRCNYNWPDSNNCVEVRFALPVILDETLTNDTYQLTTNHLTLMWERYSDKYLSKLNTCRYIPPSIDEAVTSWGLTLGLLIFFFSIGIGAIVIIRDKCIHCFNPKRRSSSIIDIMDFEHRDSNMSLNPPPIQMFPELFEQGPVSEPEPVPVWLRSKDEDPLDDEGIITHFQNPKYSLNSNGEDNEAFV